MPLRPPPGRSGRLWLTGRLAVAGRGAELLDQKRRALLREQDRLRLRVKEAQAEWERANNEAGSWLLRALTVGGSRQLRLARAFTRRPAKVEVGWRSWMGVVIPEQAELAAGELPDLGRMAGSSALPPAAVAMGQALAAGVALAAASRALEIVSSELALTARRQRVIERRWMPLLENALRNLDLRLDELEREDAFRSRRLADGSPALQR